MSQPVNICDILTLVEEQAKSARINFANAAILAASMDLRSEQAKRAGDAAMEGLRSVTAFLHQQPKGVTLAG